MAGVCRVTRCAVTLEGHLPRALGLARTDLRRAAEAFAAWSGARVGATFRAVTVILQDDAASDAAHRAILSVAGATDVITQRYDAMPGEAPGVYGELYVNADQALRVAPKRAGWSPAKELLLYVAHGMDHLSGADDRAPRDYARMRRRELAWLARLDEPTVEARSEAVASETFPVQACAYAKRLAARARPFRLQVYDPPHGESRPDEEDGFGPDPFGELTRAAKCPGLKQRFPDRVLVMTSERCFMNCRHCTRRGLLGRTPVVRTPAELARCVAYVTAHPRVRDVLLSGGDILTLGDDAVLTFVEAFASLPQVDIVRVCTRAPCTNPARVTARLAARLARSKKVWVNTQFNCAEELTDEAVAACARLIDRGMPVSCQTVLLKGVNDTPERMLALLKALSAARIRPYYVFQCDPIAGIGRFRVPLARAKEIERYCAERIGGLALPRFVADLPGARRKIPLDLL